MKQSGWLSIPLWAGLLLLAVGVACSMDDGDGEPTLATAQQLTFEPADDRRPAWSPDGGRIAFESNRDGDWEIYVVGIEGDGLTRLTDNAAQDRRPAWTPDGDAIIFESDRAGSVDLWRLRLEGDQRPEQITDAAGSEESAAVAPDGSLAFHSDRDGDRNLFMIDEAGGPWRRLTEDEADDFWPAFSPDGARLAFFSRRRDSDDIYVVNVDGSGLEQITDDAAHDFAPAWAGADAVVFARSGDPGARIHRVNTNTLAVQTLVGAAGHCSEPAVSPDQTRVAAICRPLGPREEATYDLFVVAAIWH